MGIGLDVTRKANATEDNTEKAITAQGPQRERGPAPKVLRGGREPAPQGPSGHSWLGPQGKEPPQSRWEERGRGWGDGLTLSWPQWWGEPGALEGDSTGTRPQGPTPSDPQTQGQNSLQETLDPKDSPRPSSLTRGGQLQAGWGCVWVPLWIPSEPPGQLLPVESGHPEVTVSACVWGLETQLPTVSVGGSRELVGSGVTEAGEGPEWPYVPGHPRKAPSLSKELTWANLQADFLVRKGATFGVLGFTLVGSWGLLFQPSHGDVSEARARVIPDCIARVFDPFPGLGSVG